MNKDLIDRINEARNEDMAKHKSLMYISENVSISWDEIIQALEDKNKPTISSAIFNEQYDNGYDQFK
jgi:hypothetical protein